MTICIRKTRAERLDISESLNGMVTVQQKSAKPGKNKKKMGR